MDLIQVESAGLKRASIAFRYLSYFLETLLRCKMGLYVML